MREQLKGLSLILAAFAASVLGHRQLTSPSPLTGRDGNIDATSPAAATHISRATPLEPLQPICDLLNLETTDALTCRIIDGSLSVHTIIALVPDPNNSHLSAEFDRVLAAVQRAAEEAAFVLTRWQLPWHLNAQKTDSSTAKKPPLLTEPDDVAHLSPGTLVFRSTTSTTPAQFLVIFLVGESPTGGVHRRALAAALRSALGLQAAMSVTDTARASSSSDQPIFVLGPTFSGTASSLADGLRDIGGRNALVVTGSASNETISATLTSVPGTSFVSTVERDCVLWDRLAEYFDETLGVDVSQEAALFVEGGTLYGTGSSAALGADATRTTSDRAQRHSSDPGCPSLPDGSRRRPRLLLRFPLHVAQLRAASEKASPASPPSTSSQPPRQFLELSQEGPLSPHDTLPPLSPAVTANFSELLIASAIDTIRRAGIHYVGIQASDSRDVLYLAKRFHSEAADLTFFTFGADEAFTHPDYSAGVRGMIVASSYPLLPYGHLPSPERGADSFSSSPQQGIYNATIWLLHKQGLVKRDRMIDYGLYSIHERRPPVWFSAVGHKGFELLGTGTSPATLMPALDDRDLAGFVPQRLWSPAAWHTLVWSLTLIASLACLRMLAAHSAYVQPIAKNGERPKDPFATIIGRLGLTSSWEPGAAVYSEEPVAQLYRLVALLGLGSLLFLVCLVVSIDLSLSLSGIVTARPQTWLRAISLFVASAFVGATLVRVALLLRVPLPLPSKATTPSPRATYAIHCLGAFLVVTAGFLPLVIYACKLAALSPERWLVARSRLLELDNGVTPLAPLVVGVAIILWWAAKERRMAVLLDWTRPAATPTQALRTSKRSDHAKSDSPTPRPADRALLLAYGRLVRTVENPQERLGLLVWPILILLLFQRVNVQPYHTLDGQFFGYALRLLVIVGYVLVLNSLLVFAVTWARLRVLLREIDSHPTFADTIRSLDGPLRGSPWKMWSLPPTLAPLRASLDALRAVTRLTHIPVIIRAQLGAYSRNADRAYARFKSLSEAPSSAAIAALGEARLNLTEAAKLIVDEGLLDSAVPNATGQVNPVAEFVAVRIASFIHHVFKGLRELLVFTSGGFVLMVILVAIYPFQPRHPVMAMLWCVGIAGIALVVWSFVQMERDPILSAMSGSLPGQLDLKSGFLRSVLVFSTPPLLTLLAAEFPSIGQAVWTFLAPILTPLH